MAIDYDLIIKKTLTDCIIYLQDLAKKSKDSHTYSCLNINIKALQTISSNPQKYANAHVRAKMTPIVSVDSMSYNFDYVLNKFLTKMDYYYSNNVDDDIKTALIASIDSLNYIMGKKTERYTLIQWIKSRLKSK